MKVILNSGEVIRCRWQYSQCPITVRKGNFVDETMQDCTNCILSNEKKEEIVNVQLKRHFKDADNKPSARRLAFQLAISGYSKTDRALFWDAFRKSVKKMN